MEGERTGPMGKTRGGLWAPGFTGILALLTVSLAAAAVRECVRASSVRQTLRSALAGYDEARRRLEATAILRHDYRKHLTVVRKMLSDGQTERALAYLDALADSTDSLSEGVYTGNYIIDLVLNSRLAVAGENGVRVRVSAVRVPETLGISDDALSALLCNAMDNAVAAARAGGEGQGWVHVELSEKGQMLDIEISNSCAPSDPRPGPTRRRGYGQLIMRRIVERYHGLMKAERGDGSYRLALLLPVRG